MQSENRTYTLIIHKKSPKRQFKQAQETIEQKSNEKIDWTETDDYTIEVGSNEIEPHVINALQAAQTITDSNPIDAATAMVAIIHLVRNENVRSQAFDQLDDLLQEVICSYLPLVTDHRVDHKHLINSMICYKR